MSRLIDSWQLDQLRLLIKNTLYSSRIPDTEKPTYSCFGADGLGLHGRNDRPLELEIYDSACEAKYSDDEHPFGEARVYLWLRIRDQHTGSFNDLDTPGSPHGDNNLKLELARRFKLVNNDPTCWAWCPSFNNDDFGCVVINVKIARFNF